MVIAAAALCPAMDIPLLLVAPGAVGRMAVSAALAVQLGVAVAAGVVQVSVRQARCPDAMRARVTASARWLNCALRPAGSLLGGACAAWFGVRTTVVAAVAVGAVPALLLARSPIRHLRTIAPEPPPATHPPVHDDAAAAAGTDLPHSRGNRPPEAASGGGNAAGTGGGAP